MRTRKGTGTHSSSATTGPPSVGPRRMVVTVLLGIQMFTPTLTWYSPCAPPGPLALPPPSGVTTIANGEQREKPYVTGIDGCTALAYVGSPSRSGDVTSSRSGTCPSVDDARCRVGAMSSDDPESEDRTESGRGCRESNGGKGGERSGGCVLSVSEFELRHSNEDPIAEFGESSTGRMVTTASRAPRKSEKRRLESVCGGPAAEAGERFENMVVQGGVTVGGGGPG